MAARNALLKYLRVRLRPVLSFQSPRATGSGLSQLIMRRFCEEASGSFLDKSEPMQEFNSFEIDGKRGERWIRLSRKFAKSEEINVEVTMFDPFIRKKKEMNRVTLVVNVSKGKECGIMEFVCNGWRTGIEIERVFTCGHERIKEKPYIPKFEGLDYKLKDSLYDFLEVRGIDDTLVEFLHEYMMNKEVDEYLFWMCTLNTYFQQK